METQIILSKQANDSKKEDQTTLLVLIHKL
jgi:hypothetical protein